MRSSKYVNPADRLAHGSDNKEDYIEAQEQPGWRPAWNHRAGDRNHTDPFCGCGIRLRLYSTFDGYIRVGEKQGNSIRRHLRSAKLHRATR